MPHHLFTFQEYLDVEETSPIRHEYLDGGVYAMPFATIKHSALGATLVARLFNLTADGPCRTYESSLRIRIRRTGLATYACATVVCGELERDPESPTHCTNPVALFEILSPATEDYDRGMKREHYQQIDSLRDYVVLAQDRRHAEQWTRDGHGRWNHHVMGPEGEIVLEVPGGSIVLADLYRAARL